MPEIEAPHPVKPRITQAAQQHWLAQAVAFLKRGESPEAVDAFLQEQGCPPRLRQELLGQAKSRSLGKHRVDGLRSFVLGVGVIALGGALLAWAMGTLAPSSSRGMNHTERRLAFCGAVIAVVGLQMCLVGAWKMLTGSRVDMTAERG